MKNIFYTFLLLTYIFIAGCKNNNSADNPEPHNILPSDITITKDSLKTDNTNIKNEDSSSNTEFMSVARAQSNECVTLKKFDLPEPMDFFKNVSDLEGDFTFLLSPEEADKYQTTVQQAKIMGIYSADLTYSFLFFNNENVINYYNTVYKIANNLGLTNIITEEEIRKIQEASDTDSVRVLLDNLLQRTCQVMEQNNFNEIMPFVFFGSWLESNYLLVNYLYNDKTTDYLLKQMSKQPQVINNLIDYLNDAMTGIGSYEINKQLQQIENQLKEIKQVYDKIYQTTDIILSKKQLEDLLKVLTKVRNENLKEA